MQDTGFATDAGSYVELRLKIERGEGNCFVLVPGRDTEFAYEDM